MLRVGLTGGIGSGKSTVAKAFADLGAVVVDADVLAREVVAPGTRGLAAVVAAFGEQILNEDGSLNRAALADRVFGDDAARQQLNSIVHPLIGQRTAELVAAAPQDAVLVHDIPLLVENAMGPLFDLVVVVLTDEDVRVQRLIERGLSEADARSRIAVQASDDQRREVADVIIENNGDLADVKAAVGAVWRDRILPALQETL